MSKANIIDLDKERRIAANLNRLGELLASSPAETTDRTYQYLKGELPVTETEAETVVISIRVSPSMNAKLLALAEQLSKVDSFQPGRTSRAVTKAAVIREALAMGVEQLATKADVEIYQKTAQEIAAFVVRLRNDESLTLGAIADRLTKAGYKSPDGKWDERLVERVLKANGFG